MNMTKSELRKNMLRVLSNLDNKTRKEKNEQLYHALINNIDISNAKNIMCFVSFKNEVHTHEFIKKLLKNNKNVYIPIIDNKKKVMNISKLNSFDELEVGFYGILEPKKDFIRISPPSILYVVITPGIIFSKDNYRIGYGGGYYDKFFKNKDLIAKKIGLCFDEQIMDKIPTNKYDVVVDYIIHK